MMRDRRQVGGQAGKGISSQINIAKSLGCVTEQLKNLASSQLEIDEGNLTSLVR